MSESQPIPQDIPGLRVQTLGRFRVWRGEAEIQESDWGREKARRLFQYFVTHWRALTARERIAADLWPGLDAGRADRDFKVALNALNEALQPDRAARSLAAYIARQGTSYGLDAEAPVQIDAVAFESELRAASQLEREDPALAVAHFQAALQLYQGEYLPDALYEDWASARREGLATVYLSGAGRLARLLQAEGDTVGALFWTERILSVDACWEEAYRLQMRAYLLDGNRPLALRAYERCRKTLERELNIEPMPETNRLYEQALAGGDPPVTRS